MAVYVIADIKVTDPSWIPEYAAAVHDIVHKHGGKYLSRSANVKTLEGKPLDTTLIAILQFPNEDRCCPCASPGGTARGEGRTSGGRRCARSCGARRRPPPRWHCAACNACDRNTSHPRGSASTPPASSR